MKVLRDREGWEIPLGQWVTGKVRDHFRSLTAVKYMRVVGSTENCGIKGRLVQKISYD